MSHHALEIALNLAAAWGAGSLIGAERSYNGRAAGFRTHALVGLAAAAVMTISFEPSLAPGTFPAGALRLDSTRLAQGVMTGVGFLGAGVIFKEGLSVQGLTTAACIWATAAIGLLFGVGLFGPGALVTAAVLITLVGFRVVEMSARSPVYAVGTVRFQAAAAPGEEGLRDLLGRSGVRLFDVSSALIEKGEVMEYRGGLQARDGAGLADLAARLRATPEVVEFDLARISK